MYNRSGENDPNRGTWGSVEEQERWARNAMKQTSYPSAIVYSVAVLEEGDFEVMGRELPKGTGIENSILGDEGLTIGIKRSTPNQKESENFCRCQWNCKSSLYSQQRREAVACSTTNAQIRH